MGLNRYRFEDDLLGSASDLAELVVKHAKRHITANDAQFDQLRLAA
jgi:hypothetical protein